MIIAPIPDWLLIFAVLIIVFVIYKYMPEEAKKATGTFLKAYGFYIALFLIWIYFRKKWGRVYEDPNRWPANIYYATFIIGFVLLIYFAAKSWLYEQRYYTNHLVCDNIQGSVHRFQEIVSDNVSFIVFFLGTSGSSDEKFVFPWPWPKKLLVAPKSACQFLGNQIKVMSQVHKIEDVYDLPEDVRQFIEKDTFAKWCMDNIYFGLWDVENRAKDPKFGDIELLVQKQSARLNEQDDMLKGKLTRTKAFVSDTIATANKLTGKSWSARRESAPPREE